MARAVFTKQQIPRSFLAYYLKANPSFGFTFIMHERGLLIL